MKETVAGPMFGVLIRGHSEKKRETRPPFQAGLCIQFWNLGRGMEANQVSWDTKNDGIPCHPGSTRGAGEA